MNAIQYGQKMMLQPMNTLPRKALDFVNVLSNEVGLCMETYLTAYIVYAHLEKKFAFPACLYSHGIVKIINSHLTTSGSPPEPNGKINAKR